MADLAEIAQSGIDPVTGSPLSAERRKAIFRRAQISSSNVFGGGKGGALVPISKGPDPETLAIVNTNSSAITTLQKQITSLTQQNNNIIANLGSIGSLEQKIGLLQVKVVDLGANIQQIANLLAADSALEQQKERLIREQEKRGAELGLRRGKESLLERKIQEALMWPIKQIGNKIQFGFNTLMNFMWTLLGGWLTIQGLNVLKALAKGDKKQLEDIKNNVIKSLLVVGGILSIMSIGIFRVIGSITKLAFKLGKFVLSNTIGRLFQGIWNLAKNALKFGEKTVASAAKVTMGSGTAEEIAKAGGKVTGTETKSGNWLTKLFGGGVKAEAKAGAEIGAKTLGEGAAKLGSRALPWAGAAVSGTFAWQDFQKGNYLGAALNTLSAGLDLTGAGAVFSLGSAGAAMAQEYQWDKEHEKLNQKTPAKVRPKTPVIPKSNMKESEINLKVTPTLDQTQLQTDSESLKSQITPAQTDSESLKSQITPAQTSKPSMVPFKISPMTEPKPTIVYASSGNQNQNTAPQTSLESGSATDVPLISSSDSDNMYTLYAQVNYNVIM
jgi:hypothetical protein